MKGIDPELLQDLDRHLRGAQGNAPPTAPEAHATPSARADISDVLEAIQFAASSLSATAERVEQLEAHSQASDAANRELEEQNRQLALQLGEAVQARDATVASLEAEKERANALDRELAKARSDLDKVVELVRSNFGAPG